MANTNERFVRWHGITLEARGRIIALILTLSLATIGYTFDLLKDKTSIQECSKQFCFWGLLFLLFTTIFSLFVMLNRLQGFRQTTQKIKAEIDGEPQSALDALKKKYEDTDKTTLCFFNVMVSTFGIGELLMIVGLTIEFWNKLV